MTAATIETAIGLARAAFLRACELDVAVFKPGNVSDQSPGHGMDSGLFRASAKAAAGPLFAAGAGVGARIEAAVDASWAAAGCNTNLGIVLLCAPLARAMERAVAGGLRPAVEQTLAELEVADARAAFRAIARANPGGLGSAAQADVHDTPQIGLREAMALAAGRDLIARQYRDGYADLFDAGRAALGGATTPAAVLRLYLALLARDPDSHIVRKHGSAVAQTVMQAAQAHLQAPLVASAEVLRAWDLDLKTAGINPGTTADLTVATLLIAGWQQALQST